VFVGPLILVLVRFPYTGHSSDDATPPPARFSLAQTRQLLIEVHSLPPLVTMIVLAGVTSFFVGTAFQARMPEFAHQHGSEDDARTRAAGFRARDHSS
jgi:hypothetical protein